MHLKDPLMFLDVSFSFRIAAISIASKLTDPQLGDSVEIGRLITKKEMKQTRYLNYETNA